MQQLLILFLILLSAKAPAQEPISKTLPWQQGKEIKLDLPFGDSILVKSWNKAEVKVLATVRINGEEKHEAYWLEAEDKGDVLSFKSGLHEDKLTAMEDDYRNNVSYFDGKRVKLEISYQVYAPASAALKLETISADVILEPWKASLDVRSISGDIDLHWKEKKAASFELKTISGDIYTDLESLNYPENARQKNVGIDMDASILAGGPEIELETISSNIYLRRY